MQAQQTDNALHLVRRHGFTIVELLIVIAVIGILAVITTVAYNGLHVRARTAVLTSDLTNSAKKMAGDYATNGSFALSSAAVDGGRGLPRSAGTNYQYRSTANTYCITGTNGNISYMITNTDTVPVPGGCTGDATNGNIANLVTNPGFEANITSWAGTYGTTPVARITSGAGIVRGVGVLEVNMQTWNQSGAQYSYSNLQPNTSYMVSAYVTLISGDPSVMQIRIGDGSGTRAWEAITPSLIVGQPVRIDLPWVSSATNPNGAVQIWRNGTSAGTCIIQIDNAMITQGSTLYNYNDGSSPNWVWNGTVNNSVSVGPVQ